MAKPIRLAGCDVIICWLNLVMEDEGRWMLDTCLFDLCGMLDKQGERGTRVRIFLDLDILKTLD